MGSTRLWEQPKLHRGWVDSRRLGAPQSCKKPRTGTSHATMKLREVTHKFTGNTGHVRENEEDIEGRAQ